jgi:hypothetical protein
MCFTCLANVLQMNRQTELQMPMIDNPGCSCLAIQDSYLLLSSKANGSSRHVILCHGFLQMQVATYLLVQLPNLLAPTYHLLITIACMYVTDTCLIV